MAKPPQLPPERPEPMWQAFIGLCHVLQIDFQYYKKSNPPPKDYDTPVIYPEKFKDVVIPDE